VKHMACLTCKSNAAINRFGDCPVCYGHPGSDLVIPWTTEAEVEKVFQARIKAAEQFRSRPKPGLW
jgi:hypothetical protein